MNNINTVVTGICGQIGSYVAEQRLEQGEIVHGIYRRSSSQNFSRINHIKNHPNLRLVEGDISDSGFVSWLITNVKPDKVFNMAAQSHVHTSFSQPLYTFNVDTIGVLNFLESIRYFSPATRFLTCSTSEMFGKNYDVKRVYNERTGDIESTKYQNEDTNMLPQSPYAISKLASHHLVRLYRDSYNLFATAAIMFNNESPRRGELFLTRKVTKWVGDTHRLIANHKEFERKGSIVKGVIDNNLTNSGIVVLPDEYKLRLGNLAAFRDWGHSSDYARACNMIVSSDKPDDYVISTGDTYPVSVFVEKVFYFLGILNYNDFIVIDKSLYRPAEVDYLRGDSSKLRQKFGWEPTYTFEGLIREMVESDINNG